MWTVPLLCPLPFAALELLPVGDMLIREGLCHPEGNAPPLLGAGYDLQTTLLRFWSISLLVPVAGRCLGPCEASLDRRPAYGYDLTVEVNMTDTSSHSISGSCSSYGIWRIC